MGPGASEARVRLSLRSAGFYLILVAGQQPLSWSAQAQDDLDAGTATPEAGVHASGSQLVAPQLVEPSEATYPAEALEQGLEASVLLLLSLDVTGAVTTAEVLEPAGHGFDEAAREAALRFRFAPATRAGQPIAARIRYRYVFSLPSTPAPAVVAAEVAPAPPSSAAVPEVAPLAAPAPLTAPATTAAPAAAVEVSVQGHRSEAAELLHSAEAVSVVELRTARQQTADLGEVLARTPGISVEREAGLGSETKISLAGLQDMQVKFFVDGVPLEESGFPALADIPVNLVERVEIYRGVVPIRFGADALGGALNVVTNRASASHLGGSYQVGAFNTHRATVGGRYQDKERGWFLGGSSFFDFTENSYKIDVLIPDMSTGRVDPDNPTSVRRKHDDYRALGTTLDVGLVDRPWARRLMLTGFMRFSDKEYQSNASQTVPYGEVRSSSRSYGATLRYEVDLTKDVSLELVANYAHNHYHFIDKADWVYDWYGTRIRSRKQGGEITCPPYKPDAAQGRCVANKSDLRTWEDALFGRANLQWSIARDHLLRVTTSPSAPWRGGHEAIVLEPNQRDKGDGMRRMLTIVSGVEYEANLFGERLSNIAFFKHYWQHNVGEDPLYFVPGDVWQRRENYVHLAGGGDALRFRILPWLYAKASYEYAARLPEPEEYLGDGLMIGANFSLKPEISHNGNLSVRAELANTRVGEVIAEVNGFVRETDDLIQLVGLLRQAYANVRETRALGFDGSLNYVSPGRYVMLNGMLSWQDVRNLSDTGIYKPFKGERIPSRPWLFASWGARLSFQNVLLDETRIEPFYNGRWVHSFNRSWDNYGDPLFKIVMPSQMTHSVGVTWLVSKELAHLTLTLEIDNVTDAKLFDFFGAQRAGRAFYAKVTGDLR